MNKLTTQPKTLIEMAGIVFGTIILFAFLIGSLTVLVPALLYHWLAHRTPFRLFASPPLLRSAFGPQVPDDPLPQVKSWLFHHLGADFNPLEVRPWQSAIKQNPRLAGILFATTATVATATLSASLPSR
ncbi:MAG: hypothetical protein Q8L93_08410 [Rhodocyclaceae bacterium]|nr:hypothetical protein [Rhodocyclaceae bacterium]